MKTDRPEIPLRRTCARIDLGALARNLQLLRERSTGTALIFPVKADGYGHGMIAVARRAVREGVELLAVAEAQELCDLRAAGVTHPVLVMEDLFPEELPAVIRDPEARFSVSGMEYALRLSGAAMAAGRRVPVHLNLDTGMGRMGMLSEQPVEAVRRIAALPGLQLEGIFSHFPEADEADLRFTQQQLRRFAAVLQDVEAAGLRPRYRHLANSAGLLACGQEACFNAVRPGISAYGLFPSRHLADQLRASIPLEPCLRLESAVLKVTRYDQDWTIGYGRTYRVQPGSRIVVVPIGYGDGYSRALSNRGYALLHGHRLPVCGRVSMDLITLDATGLPDEPAVGDEVVLIGTQAWPGSAAAGPAEASWTAEDMADCIDTIPYEITCALTPRVPRLHHS